MDETVNTLVDKIQQSFSHNDFKLYEPYIRHIRFPQYKIIEENSKINFDFPLTVLVGANGTNKTSILQAIYGCAAGKNVGEYWFNSSVDKIADGDSRHCFIYGYKHKVTGKIVEALKTRTNKIANPDYWEPSRPLRKYAMQIPDKGELRRAKNTASTRWDLIIKTVSYEDCKAYMPAYDLFFYHSLFESKTKIKSRQDFVRSRSIHLSKCIESNSNTYTFCKTERIESNRVLDEVTCKHISWIMNKEYVEIRVVNHSFYTTKPSKTVIIKFNDLVYSEAFAGTGEARLILLVDRVIHAQPKSLILIDEPEISLHPEAQERLKIFLLEQLLENKHQIVLSTHSPTMIRDLPPQAIKLLSVLPSSNVSILSNVSYKEAFYELGHREEGKINIFVEDKLVLHLIKSYLHKRHDNRYDDSISINIFPGGAKSIITQHISVSSQDKNILTYYILDGDQNNYPFDKDKNIIQENWIQQDCRKVDVDLIPVANNEDLSDIIKVITGCEVKFFPNGNRGHLDEDGENELQRKFIEFWKTHVWFLNSTTPERAIIESVDLNANVSDDGKNYFVDRTRSAIGSSEQLTADDILNEQRRCINSLADDCPLFCNLDWVFEQIKELK